MIDLKWARADRILLVRLDNLGDVLVTTPAIHAVRECLPHAEITLLASPIGAQTAELNPDIDDVIVYQAPWMDPWHELEQDPAREEEMIRKLSQRSFDGAIIFTSFRQSPLPSAYLCYLAGIPLRLGASLDGSGSLLTTRHKHADVMMHEVERGLDLVRAIGISTEQRDLVLTVPEEDRTRAHVRLAQMRDVVRGTGPAVVLHSGCSMPARTYPWERYAEVADLLIDQFDATILLTGTTQEQDLAHRLLARMEHPLANLRTQICAGHLHFGELCAVIEASDLVITNNTGPMHIAAAVKTPVVCLFALTNPPEQWGPWMTPHRQLYRDVPCRLCYNRVCPYHQECLTLVSPQEVVEAASDLLAVDREWRSNLHPRKNGNAVLEQRQPMELLEVATREG